MLPWRMYRWRMCPAWGMSEEKGRKREWEKREEEGGGLKKKEGMREERREEGTQSQKERSEGKGRLEIVDGRKERRREATKNNISSLLTHYCCEQRLNSLIFLGQFRQQRQRGSTLNLLPTLY